MSIYDLTIRLKKAIIFFMNCLSRNKDEISLDKLTAGRVLVLAAPREKFKASEV